MPVFYFCYYMKRHLPNRHNIINVASIFFLADRTDVNQALDTATDIF